MSKTRKNSSTPSSVATGTGRTHITIILDRTGSMEEIRDDTIGGFNAFLKKQKQEPGNVTLTLVQFDSQDPYEVIHRFTPITEIPELTRETFVPRASTPLLDAMGRGINDLEKSLDALAESERPSRVVFVVVTDGMENASHEFTRAQVEKMIAEKSARQNWQFVFLSADLDAIGDARGVGIRSNSVIAFEKNAQGSEEVWAVLSERTMDYRRGVSEKLEFLDEDRRHPDDPMKRRK